MTEAIGVIVGVLGGSAIAHLYYRQGQADFDALQRRFDGLQQVVQQAVDRGLVTADRTPAGEINWLGPPSSPDRF
jgi:hypothetical protein